jgi:anti-sigma regulatory factor (Ser/Thr protein kinase)
MDARVSIGRVADEVDLSVSRVRQLAEDGVVPFTRTDGGHRRFDLDEAVRAIAKRTGPRKGVGSKKANGVGDAATAAPGFEARLPLADIEEHEVWREATGALDLGADSPSGRIIEYAFGEMLNNAIDHSDGRQVDVSVRLDRERLSFEVRDDGVGALRRLREGLGLADDLAAVQELSKGKRTTDPAHHTGEGIFFTSKAVDRFELASGELVWSVDNERGDQTVARGPAIEGTRVRARIASDSSRELRSVFEEYTSDLTFDKTRIVVKLFERGDTFLSRSEAKRVFVGLEEFREVVVDFAGVEQVGQGFVDELLRVWPATHPETTLAPVNMSDAVEFMVRRGLGGNG